MIVYANRFTLEPDKGPIQIIQLIARWLGQHAEAFVDSERLAEGIRDLRLNDDRITSLATRRADGRPTFPYSFCVRLSHKDPEVRGRRWTTELGLQQMYSDSPVDCSVLLRTDEVSARVSSPIRVTRPRIVLDLLQQCRASSGTPGMAVKRLTEDSAVGYSMEIERPDRKHPIVVISSSSNGGYVVAPERLRTVLIGLADVVQIPEAVNTFDLERKVGRRYTAFGGAINIIFPLRSTERGPYCETVLLKAEHLERLREGGTSVESEVLAAVTHRTNLPHSWRHISLEGVSEASLRGQMAGAIARLGEIAKASNESSALTAELNEYRELLEQAFNTMSEKDSSIASLQKALDEQQSLNRKLEAANESLKYALSGRQAAEDEQEDEMVETMKPFRDAFRSVLRGQPTLTQCLEAIQMLFGERVRVLDSAYESARESDRGGFKHGERAFRLLENLCGDYWEALNSGKGDQQAKAAFGKDGYAATESTKLSAEGKRRRTFSYRGSDIFMEKHLRSGVKDSLGETLRIHFEWVAGEKRIVVGHCGKHLDF
jgi:hypothetical protein